MGVFAPRKSTVSSNKTEPSMSTKDGTADEREEGEIIDEFEDIISSDEEFSMRQRIEELEAKNAELEKIANISAVYGSGNYDYIKKDSSSHLSDRYPLISIDISDDEDYPPAPPMSRIAKRRKSLQHSSYSRRKMIHASSSSHRHRKKSSSPPPAPLYRPSDKLLLSMFHDRVVSHSSHSSKRKRKSKKSHSTKSSRQKPREYYISDSDDDYNFDNVVNVDDSYENFSSSDADRGFSINREELRVALARNTHRNEQHVSLKDRLIRRKENTDTLNENITPDPQEEVEEEESKRLSCEEKLVDVDDNLEEQELRIIALKSAVLRKHLVRKKRDENVAYSPSDFDEIYANTAVSPSINNIDDTEVCNSMEISPVPSPKMILSDDEGIDTKPVDMDIANSDSDCELPSYDKWIPIEQIPLPNNIGMGGGELYTPTPLRYNERVVMPPEVQFESAPVSPGNLDSEVEEEELALRALLLAKMNSPKVNKIVKVEPPKIEQIRTPDPDISLEAEALRDFLINNMKKKTQPTHSSASVLKEAVRRLTARNSSPVEGFTEIPVAKMDIKTAEETEMELSEAITEMAKVKIGVERVVEPKRVTKKVAVLKDRGDVKKRREGIDLAPKEVAKRKGLADKVFVEPNRNVKRNVLPDTGDLEHRERAKVTVSGDEGFVEPSKIIKTEPLECRVDVEHKEAAKKKVAPGISVVEPNNIAKSEALQRNGDAGDVGPKGIVRKEVVADKGRMKPKKSVALGNGNGLEPDSIEEAEVLENSSEEPMKIIKSEVSEGRAEVEPGEIVRQEVAGDKSEVEGNEIMKEDVVGGVEMRKENFESKELGGTNDLREVEMGVEHTQVVADEMENTSKKEGTEPILGEDVDPVEISGEKVVFNEPLPSDSLNENNETAVQEPSQRQDLDLEKEIKICEAALSDERTENVVPTPMETSIVVPVEELVKQEVATSSEREFSTLIREDTRDKTSETATQQTKTEIALETISKPVVEPIKSLTEEEKGDAAGFSVPDFVESMPENNGESISQLQSKVVSVLVEKKKTSVKRTTTTTMESGALTVKIETKTVAQTVSKAAAKPKEIPSKALPNVVKSNKPELLPKKSLPIVQPVQKPVVPKIVCAPPSTSRTKIVKPNKVINQPTTDLKRKSVDNAAVKTSIPPSKKTKTEDHSNRLITAAEIPQVKQLIIQLRASDTESEYSAMSADDFDYDEGGEDSRVSSFLNSSITIGNEYYDIASPISLPMESPCDTPTRAASPAINVTLTTQQPVVEKSIVNDFFQAKLDQFLKNVRSKVTDSAAKKSIKDDQPVVTPVISTPVAVRHLPEASQQEYRRLINRMKMLERQKQAKNINVTVSITNGASATAAVPTDGDNKTLMRKVLFKNAIAQPAACDIKKIASPSTKHVPQKPKTPEKVTANVVQSSSTTTKSIVSSQKVNVSPQKSVVTPQKGAQSSPKVPLAPTNSPSAAKPSKENLLGLYENSYRKTGTSIILNLDKSIELVRVAREAKMAKLKHEHRLRELQKEMDEVARSIQQQQERITEIYPQICSSHRMIESLKTRRGKINKAVTTLGRSVIGPNYSMNNDQKPIISEKSKKLAAEIKFVNNMKLSDVEKWESENRRSSSDDATPVAVPNDLNTCLTVKQLPVLVSDKHMPGAEESDSPNTTPVPEDTEKPETDMNDTIVPEALSNKEEHLNDSTNGHEEALETEPVDDKKTHNPEIVETTQEEENENAQIGGAKLQDYISPLSHLRDDERQINPNGIVCPYQLMGQCDDKDCKYMHLDE